MPDSYPYIISNNKVEPIFSRIRSAAKPERFTRETLAKWEFTASNDRRDDDRTKGAWVSQ